MNELTSAASETLKSLGQSFLIAYYLPAAIFVIAHLYLLPYSSLVSVSTESPENADALNLPLIGEIGLDLIATLLLPLLIGIMLIALNSLIIRGFEGKLPWLRRGLLSPLTRRNEKLCQERYSKLIGLQQEYRRVTSLVWQANSAEEEPRLRQQLAGLAQQINEEHKQIEEKYPVQTLPHDVRRVAPTRFGNTYAMAEEYTYERYGADSVLFWARLRKLMYDADPTHSERLSQQKTSLDMTVNFAFLSGLLAIETIVILFLSGYNTIVLWLGVVSVILFISFYQAGVGAIAVMGELFKTSFDYHRHLILESFNLKAPPDLSAEQAVWLRLAAFIQRGDDFYFPATARNSDGDGQPDEKSADPNNVTE